MRAFKLVRVITKMKSRFHEFTMFARTRAAKQVNKQIQSKSYAQGKKMIYQESIGFWTKKFEIFRQKMAVSVTHFYCFLSKGFNQLHFVSFFRFFRVCLLFRFPFDFNCLFFAVYISHACL